MSLMGKLPKIFIICSKENKSIAGLCWRKEANGKSKTNWPGSKLRK